MHRRKRAGVFFLGLILLLSWGEYRDERNRKAFLAAAKNMGWRPEAAERLWKVAKPELEQSYRLTARANEELASDWAVDAVGRLSADEVLASWKLREVLAGRDMVFCAAMWTGTADSRQLDGVISRATDEELRSWFRLQNAVTDAALNNRPRSWKTPSEAAEVMAEGWTAILADMTGDEHALLQRAQEAAAHVSSTDACAAMKVLFAHASEVQEPLRPRFLAVLQSGQPLP